MLGRLLRLSLINIISLIFHAFHINTTFTRRISRRSLGTLEENVLSEAVKHGRIHYTTLLSHYFQTTRVNPCLLNCSFLTHKLCTVPVNLRFLRLCKTLAVRKQWPIQFQAIPCVVSCSPAGKQYTESRNFNLSKLNFVHLAFPTITLETGLFVLQPGSELCDKFSELNQTAKLDTEPAFNTLRLFYVFVYLFVVELTSLTLVQSKAWRRMVE